MKKDYHDYFLHLKVLQYHFGGDLKKAQYIHELSRRLTSTGFEIYCVKLINKTYGIEMHHTGKLGTSDGGLDGVDFRNHIYMQCKKYGIGTDPKTGLHWKGKVSIHEMKDFIASIVIAEKEYAHSTLEGFFITTGFLNKGVKDAADKVGIEYIDFYKLYELSSVYSLLDFEREYGNKNYYHSYQPKFDFDIDFRDSTDILRCYLKSVREKLCLSTYGNETDTGFVFTNFKLEGFIQRYNKGKKDDFSNFKDYESSVKEAMNIWES